MVSYKGTGESSDDPIIIGGVSNNMEAVRAEYSYLSQKFGVKGVDWNLLQQSLMGINDRMMDKMDIELSDGRKITLYFDITEHFGSY